MSQFDGAAYQARIDALASGGMDVHGEASFVMSLDPRTVLDAGCGTGRVAIELARRGAEVVAVDVDPSMLAEARRHQPDLAWIEADLAALELERVFDVVLLAGNVPLFCPAEARPALVRSCAAHVDVGGALVAGFQLDRGYRLGDWDAGCRQAGLQLAEQWSTWDREPFDDTGGYAVTVYRRPG